MLKILGWDGYEEGYKRTFDAFQEDTGIRISFYGVPNQDEMHKLALTQEFDIACPTTDRLMSWCSSDLIAPLDETRIGYERIEPTLHADAHTVIDGKRMGSPCVWGGAGIGHHTGKAPIVSAKASLMDLFDPVYAGQLAMREDTAFVAAGRALEEDGKLPYPFADSYLVEDRMIANYDVIGAFLAKHSNHVARFWFSEEDGVNVFRSGDCIIGYSWDSSLAKLDRAGLPFRFVTPREGAICYLQNFVINKKADKGLAHEWIAWVNTPKGSSHYASALGVNPCAIGAMNLMDANVQDFIARSYPPEAQLKLWWQPEQPVWFIKNRKKYARAYRNVVGK